MMKDGFELKEVTKYGSLIFEKTNTVKIKYYVDIVDELRYIERYAEDNILEYEEICKEAGWELIGKLNKIMILKSSSENTYKIHTDEEEKFNIIKNAIFKSLIGEVILL